MGYGLWVMGYGFRIQSSGLRAQGFGEYHAVRRRQLLCIHVGRFAPAQHQRQ
jgi:hypothetical protein